jgi:hypothetical protein
MVGVNSIKVSQLAKQKEKAKLFENKQISKLVILT